jgi:hypothetical protein
MFSPTASMPTECMRSCARPSRQRARQTPRILPDLVSRGGPWPDKGRRTAWQQIPRLPVCIERRSALGESPATASAAVLAIQTVEGPILGGARPVVERNAAARSGLRRLRARSVAWRNSCSPFSRLPHLQETGRSRRTRNYPAREIDGHLRTCARSPSGFFPPCVPEMTVERSRRATRHI